MIFEERLFAMISSDERQFLINQLAWIGISFGMNLPNTISYIISWYCREFLSTCFIAKKLAHRKSIPGKHLVSIVRIFQNVYRTLLYVRQMYEIFFVIDNNMSWKTIFLLQSVSHNERQVLGHDQEHWLMGRRKKVYANSQNDKTKK
jgi:hypothetical protein